MKSLSQKEFQSALEKGLGRAFLQVQAHGEGNFRNDILNATLKNFVYDPQCEGNRADWLYTIIELTQNKKVYENALLSNLPAIDEEREMDQCLNLLKEFAGRGSPHCREALYSFFDKSVLRESWVGGEQLIEIDGLEGLLHVIEKIGRRLKEDPDYWEDDYLLHAAKLRLGEAKTEKALQEWAHTSEHVSTYLNKLTKSPSTKLLTEAELLEKKRERYPFGLIMQNVDEGKGEYPGLYMKFGEIATDTEIQQVYERLLSEYREEQLIRLFWIFRRRALPDTPQKLISFSKSSNHGLREACLTALTNTSNSTIRNLALTTIRAPDWNEAIAGIELLRLNYQSGDAELISELLHRAPSDLAPDTAHSIVWSIRKVADVNDDTHVWRHPYLWSYHNSPCMINRSHAVEWLLSHNALPAELLEECLHDGYEEIRQLASEHSQATTS